jgi:hypothetical protein
MTSSRGSPPAQSPVEAALEQNSVFLTSIGGVQGVGISDDATSIVLYVAGGMVTGELPGRVTATDSGGKEVVVPVVVRDIGIVRPE